jgi:Flp pilus assembly protein TadG
MNRGQSLVELAVSAPVILLLALGAVATVRVVDARAGLEAATQSAAAEAARAPDPINAQAAAQVRFSSMVSSYPLQSAHVNIELGKFNRSDQVVAIASGAVDISWAALLLPSRLTLESRATVPLESWRSHTR